MNLPDEVTTTTSRYLELIDKAVPDLVVGLYLTGSVPLGDFRPGRSDIDGVVVVAEPLKDVDAVREVHAQLPGEPAFDVTYLTPAELASPPEAPLGGPVSPVLRRHRTTRCSRTGRCPGSSSGCRGCTHCLPPATSCRRPERASTP